MVDMGQKAFFERGICGKKCENRLEKNSPPAKSLMGAECQGPFIGFVWLKNCAIPPIKSDCTSRQKLSAFLELAMKQNPESSIVL